MIEKVSFFQGKCENCQEIFVEKDDKTGAENVFFSSERYLILAMYDAGWLIDDNNEFCKKCVDKLKPMSPSLNVSKICK